MNVDPVKLAEALAALGFVDLVQALVVAPAPFEPLLTRHELAHDLGISAPTVDRYARRGMPCLMLAGLPRFELAACRAWIADDKARAPKLTPDDEKLLATVRVTSRA